MTKTCKFCERTTEAIAEVNLGICHAGTNALGNVICWDCAKSAYEQMKERGELLDKLQVEIAAEILNDEPYEGEGCGCPACRMSDRIKAAGYSCTSVEERELMEAMEAAPSIKH